jgi:EpsI family protein
MTMRARLVVVMAALVVSAGLVARADRSEPVPMRAPFAEFPMQVAGWHGIQHPAFDEKVLAILGLTDYLTRAYVRDGATADLYVGYWQSQRQGDTIHSPLNCLPGAGWEPVSRETVAVPGAPAGSTMNRVVIQNGLDRQFVLSWYQSHGRLVASEYWSKLYLVSDAMRLNRTDGSLVRVIAPVIGDGPAALDRADAVATSFVTDLVPKLDGFLPR